MKSGEIYQFEDPLEIFVQVFNEKTQRNPQFSIRAWSRKLGFRNPSHVAEVLNGRRNLTVEFGLRVSDALDFNEEEKTYFESLVFLSNARKPSEKTYFSNVAKRLRVDNGTRGISPDHYALIRDWYYGVLDEMTCLADFRPDPQYLAKRLGFEVTSQALGAALGDLLRLGSIEKDAKGRMHRPRKVFFKKLKNGNQIEDANLRRYHRKFIEMGLVALDEQTTNESLFRTTNIPIKIRDFEELKGKIEDFVRSLGKMESSKSADEVYQFSLQFCRVTKKITPGD